GRHRLALDTAANVRAYRKLRGMTLLQIAGICGTTPQTIQRLETANMTMSLDWLQALADALKVEPYQLVGGQGVGHGDCAGAAAGRGERCSSALNARCAANWCLSAGWKSGPVCAASTC